MSTLFSALQAHARHMPDKVALSDGRRAVTYGELPDEIEKTAKQLHALHPQRLAILADNACAWVITDLAAQWLHLPCVPLPGFFSAAQIRHVLRTAGIDLILSDAAEPLASLLENTAFAPEAFLDDLASLRIPQNTCTALPHGTQKITFTSGTSGTPKGVCLGLPEMQAVAAALCQASAATPDDRHLCLLPLATLLENIGGVHTALLAGATVCVPRLHEVGLSGSSGLDVHRMIAALDGWEAQTAILVPQMLQALVTAGQAGVPLPAELRFLAVGGGTVASGLLHAAHALGLPVHEGYGLSECASVVTLNRPGENRPGSVGKPLPHRRVMLADDGEILVHAPDWRGYLGAQEADWRAGWLATGDMGHFDADGYLYVTGRKKNMFITAFGRNVLPEWVEGELMAQAPIVQAAVFGEARPFNCAVIVAPPAVPPQEIDHAVHAANDRLPDYARIRAWLVADTPFHLGNGMATANGRWRREAIQAAYGARLAALYQS